MGKVDRVRRKTIITSGRSFIKYSEVLNLPWYLKQWDLGQHYFISPSVTISVFLKSDVSYQICVNVFLETCRSLHANCIA